jgi:hypothetical protein
MTTKSKTAEPTATAATPAAAKPTITPPAATQELTRVQALHAMLSRAGGASVNEIAQAFGWQSHSCRGLISTSRSKLGWDVSTAKIAERGVVYAIAAAALLQAEVSAKASAATKPETKAKGKAAKPKAKRARAGA